MVFAIAGLWAISLNLSVFLSSFGLAVGTILYRRPKNDVAVKKNAAKPHIFVIMNELEWQWATAKYHRNTQNPKQPATLRKEKKTFRIKFAMKYFFLLGSGLCWQSDEVHVSSVRREKINILCYYGNGSNQKRSGTKMVRHMGHFHGNGCMALRRAVAFGRASQPQVVSTTSNVKHAGIYCTIQPLEARWASFNSDLRRNNEPAVIVTGTLAQTVNVTFLLVARTGNQPQPGHTNNTHRSNLTPPHVSRGNGNILEIYFETTMIIYHAMVMHGKSGKVVAGICGLS